MKRSATAIWTGEIKTGSGKFGLESGVLSDQPYSFKTRFENEDGKQGTNPDELIAAAHASCFAMQLSAFLGQAGHPAEKIEAKATVEIIPGTGITGSHLQLTAKVPGMDVDTFMAEAERAKANCPVSKALAAIEITLDAKLEG